MGQFENVNLTKIYDTDEFPLGARHEENGGKDEFEFVGYHYGDGSVTATAGHIGYVATTGTESAPFPTVTEDYDTATKTSTGVEMAYGMFMSALSNGKFGWIQKRGQNRVAMLTDGSVVANAAVAASNANGTIRDAANTDITIIGRATAADSGTVSAVGTVILNFD